MARATWFEAKVDVLEDSTASVPVIASSTSAESDALVDLDIDQAQNVQGSLSTAKTNITTSSADSLAADLQKLRIGDDGTASRKENTPPDPQVASSEQQSSASNSTSNGTEAGTESAPRKKHNRHVEFVTPAAADSDEVQVAAEAQGWLTTAKP